MRDSPLACPSEPCGIPGDALATCSGGHALRRAPFTFPPPQATVLSAGARRTSGRSGGGDTRETWPEGDPSPRAGEAWSGRCPGVYSHVMALRRGHTLLVLGGYRGRMTSDLWAFLLPTTVTHAYSHSASGACIRWAPSAPARALGNLVVPRRSSFEC